MRACGGQLARGMIKTDRYKIIGPVRAKALRPDKGERGYVLIHRTTGMRSQVRFQEDALIDRYARTGI